MAPPPGDAHPVAYKNDAFLDSTDARPLRILAEYLEPLHHFRQESVHDTVVFCGSARLREDGPLGRYYREAQELARLLSEWARPLQGDRCHSVVCTGGGPGIMEAANRGASEAGGKTVGLNIGLPHEQRPNPFITPSLNFQFHYFFMRKFWFSYLARALVVFPGGFGTLDELMELLTLVQTGKLKRKILILLYGPDFWREVLNFDALVRHGMISPEDVELFRYADTPKEALAILTAGVRESKATEPERESPAIAESRDPHEPR
jgi:uncharacterized protein (TIGR00730 family)